MSSVVGDVVVTHPPFAARSGPGGPGGVARATTWWGRAWVRAIEEAAYAEADLRQGRTLARGGRIGGISISPGGIVASVGDGSALATAAVRIPVLDGDAAATLVEVVAAESGRVGALLAGELPYSLVEHAEESGVELLPFGGELECSCTCDAWLDPCAHALAVLYQTRWLVDADPLVLLHLRGMPRDVLLSRLHALDPPARVGVEEDDLVLETAVHAALRAARLLELFGHPDAELDHLY